MPATRVTAADWGPWRLGGPPGAAIRSLAADAGPSGVVYALTVYGELLRWSPAANEWQRLPWSPWTSWIRPHPRNSGWLYVWGARSRDFGDTWEPYHTREQLLIHPLDPRVQWTWDGDGLERTTDDGATWQALAPPVADEASWLVALHPTDTETAWAAAGSEGVLRTTDGGTTWHVARGGLEYTPSWGGGRTHYYLPRAVRATLDRDLVLWGLITVASAPDGDRLIRSLDGGLNWEIVAPLSWSVELAVHPSRPRTLYVLQGDHTVLTSEDAGATWRVLRGPVPFWHPCAHALTNWATGLAVMPPDGATVLYGTEQDGVFRSDDGGETWASANRGLHFAYVTHVAVSPRTPGRVFVADLARGIFRSDDAGATWHEPTLGVDLSWRWPGGGMCPDNVGPPAEGGRSVAVTRASETVIATFWEGASRSHDLGETWSYLPLFNSGIFQHVAVDQGRNRVFASNWSGIYRSDDDARTWAACGSGLSNADGLAIHEASGTLVAWTRWGVAASGDGCRTWLAGPPPPSRACPEPNAETNDIVFNPVIAGHAVAATTCGVFVSDNGIHQWRRGGLEGRAIVAIALDPLSPKTIYAAAGGRPWVSRDGGDSFQAIESWPLPGGATALAVDPLGRRLYVGTSQFGLLSTEIPSPSRPPISRLRR